MRTYNIFAIIMIVALSFNYAHASTVDDAKALIAKGDYLAGMNILTTESNAADQNLRAQALLAYGNFYEDFVGNPDYATSFYENVLRTTLGESDPLKIAAKQRLSKIKLLRIQYGTEDNLLRRMRPAESSSPGQIAEQIQQLLSIIQHKPDYYKISEVYYQLGRNYFAADELRAAHSSLSKSLEIKPAVNFFLPVNVWIDASYQKMVREYIHSGSWGILGSLLIITTFAFYITRPWRWIRFRHVLIGILMFILWTAVFAGAYFIFIEKQPISETTLANANAAPPFFIISGPHGPYWSVLKTLFLYGVVGTAGLYVFLLATSRMKIRWAALFVNVIFALLLFSSLIAIFYMRTCDQKSLFASGGTGEVTYYINGGNYFVTFGMEPYVLTNPKAYPNLALSNVSDRHMLDWIRKHGKFTGSKQGE